MRKTFIFLLVITLVFSSFTSFAADGDIIHTGLKRIYRAGTSDITNDLINDVTNNIDNPGFLGQYYREKTINGEVKYINVADEENAHSVYLRSLVNNPADLERYIRDNAAAVEAGLEAKTNDIAKTFDEILDKNKGNIEDYIGNSDARRLKNPDNYSTPVPGVADNTTRIMKLTRPSGIGATKWIYKIVDTPTTLKTNDVVNGPAYTAQADIPISDGKYLLLCATDKDNKVKAYANIAITANMIKVPRVTVDEDNTIEANFMASVKKSGATVISDLPVGAWKMAVIDTKPDKVYEDSKFTNSVDYIANMELVLANEAELDNMPADFKKDILVYSVENGKIKKYKVFSVSKDKISGALDAKKLSEDDYSTPVKGNVSGTTRIAKLLGLDSFGATKWMYAFVEGTDIVPKLDRMYTGSVSFEVGQDIIVKTKYLMILATDNDGKVRAYEIMELDTSMIKDPPAEKFEEFTHYSMPEKGTIVGTTKFQYLNYDGATLYYELSDKIIDIPEMGSNLPSHINKEDFKILSNANGLADNIKIFEPEDLKLKDENGFIKYMVIYAVDNGKVIAATHNNFKLTPDNVRLPEANKLPWRNYKELELEDPLEPGLSPNSTILKKLNKNNIVGASNLKYVYTIVNDKVTPGINEIIRSTRTLEAGKELTPAKAGDYLLILLVDSSNRTKYYTNVELTSTNIRSFDAPRLVLTKNYSHPEPGTEFGSTRFNLLGFEGIVGASQFMIATSNMPFKPVELNSKVTEATPYATINEDNTVNYRDANGIILGVDIKDKKYLLLIATDSEGKVKGYINLTLTENNIRGNKAKTLTSVNFTIGKGTKPGTIKFTKLSPFGIGNTNWMYKWAETDVFTDNPPFENQIMTDAAVIRTKAIDQYTAEAIDDIKVGDSGNYGHILLLAVNGNRVVGYAVIDVKSENVQSTADILDIALEKGTNPDSTKIIGNDTNKAKKYMISTTPMEKPGPMADLPRTGVKDVPSSKEISVRVGEYLRIFDVDTNNKILGFKDITIESEHIKQGEATLEVLTHDGKNGKIYEILEGRIKANAVKIKIELTGASWTDVISDKTIKDIFLNGFKADGTEQEEWSKVVQKIKDGRFSISKSGEILTITTTATEDYNISKDQKITLIIPASAIVGAINPIKAIGEIVVKPTIDAKVSGSIVNNIRQSAINSGNATIVIDIVDSKWIDNIEATENKQAILNGLKGDGGDNSPWNKENDGLKVKIGVDNIKLIDPQRISITIPKNEVKIDSPETITLTIPQGLIDSAKSDIIAAPSFTIYPDILPVEGTVDETVILESPKYLNALKDKDTWIVTLDEKISFKDDFSATKDITTSTLPSGLKLEIIKLDNNKQLSIKLAGKTTKELSNGAINLVIKASAINEKNYSDSKTIPLEYTRGESINLNNVTYEIKGDGIYLKFDAINKDDIMYSTNTTNGSNGDWATIPDNYKISGSLEPITIYVKETKQPDNFKLVGKLVSTPAPTGIVIDNYSYNDTKLTVTLNEYLGLEYKLGTPNEWKDVPENKQITMDKDSILVVRKKAFSGTGEGGSLPSLPTPKLNGLYLGNVKLDVSQSKILGATRDMRYKLSNDGTWNTINSNDPIVEFKEGNEVWISEAKNEKNAKPLGAISQAKMDNAEAGKVKTLLANETDTDGIYYHIRNKKLINGISINLQYNITKGEVPIGSWHNLEKNATVNNVNFVPGNMFVRKIDGSNSLPSNPVKIFEIAEPINPPKIEINEDSKTLLYEAPDGSYKKLDDSFEYKINTGEYQNGSFLETDSRRLGNITVYVKRKATKDLLASKEVSFKFTENISLANVGVNVAEGIIDGTTTKMEYRTDASKDNPNSPWKPASANKTSINMYEGMNIWIRETGKPSTEKLTLENLGKMTSPEKTALAYNIAQKFIKNNSGNILEYRINDGNWNTINASQIISIEFVPTRLFIRTKATIDKLASDVVDVMNEELAYPDEAPEVVVDDDKNEVKSINGSDSISWGVYEFKLKTHTEWIPGSMLKGYDLSGDKIVQIRKSATTATLPSEIAEIIFTKNIYLDKVELRQTTPLKLLSTEPEMEYQVYLNDKPIPTTWVKATAGTTTLDSAIKITDVKLIIIRDSRNKNDLIVLVGAKNDLPIDLGKISYKIEKNGISFTGISNRMKYKLSSSSDWKIGNDSDISTDGFELVEITIEDTLYPTITRTIAVSERAETPKITVGKVEYIEDNKSKITLVGFDKTKMEYSIDGGKNWTSSNDSPIEITKDNILVVRAKAILGAAGVGKLPSLPTTQLNGISLIDVKVDIENKKLLNTAKSMEYSLDSTDGKNGTWKQASDKETVIQLELGTVIWIRENSNTDNARKIGPIGQEPMPILTSGVFFNISTGKIANFTDQDLEYRVSGGGWKSINETLGTSKVAYNVDFRPGPLEFRRSANGSNSASKPTTLTVIKVPGSKPQIVYNDIEDKVFLPAEEEWSSYEYKITIDGISSSWISAEELEKEDLSGSKKVEIRKKATPKDLPSEVQAIQFTDNLIKRVGLSIHVKPFELNGTTNQMQYRINGGDWKDCSNGTTQLIRADGSGLMDISVVDIIEVCEIGKQANTVIVYKK